MKAKLTCATCNCEYTRVRKMSVPGGSEFSMVAGVVLINNSNLIFCSTECAETYFTAPPEPPECPPARLIKEGVKIYSDDDECADVFAMSRLLFIIATIAICLFIYEWIF